MDHEEFMQLVTDCQLMNEKVTQREINVIFHDVNEEEIAPGADNVRSRAAAAAAAAMWLRLH